MNYHASVWRKAMKEAEADVMRATATPSGGRMDGEELLDYVQRAAQIQGGAIARWMTAKAELELAESNGEPQHGEQAEKGGV